MTPRSLQTVLRTLTATEPAASDGELLRRFLAADPGAPPGEAAFAELVRRHSRLVWAVCRNLTGSDAAADDAFQATFLVLFRNAGKVREGGRLSAWLHGVAARVCSKARQAAKRREAREQATAVREQSGPAVPDSAWDRALAAVHEEAAKLPDTLRVPFVLCCLEGKGATEAAEQLGWKLGTLSGRLTRAKDALLAKLDARGLTLGAVAGLGLAVPPTAVVARAMELVRAGSAIPSSVLQLSQGVIGMSLKSMKLLAAGVLLACGMGVGFGGTWLPTAEAQDPNKPLLPPQALPGRAASADDVKRLQAQLEEARALAEMLAQKAKQAQLQAEAEKERALRAAEEALVQQRNAVLEAAQREALVERDAYTRLTRRLGDTTVPSKWEYDFVPVSDLDKAGFVKLVNDREMKGWDFAGTTPMRLDGKSGTVWVFRRHTKAAALGERYVDEYKHLAEWLRYAAPPAPPALPGKPANPTPPIAPSKPADPTARVGGEAAQTDEVTAIEAQMRALQDRLALLKSMEKPKRVVSQVLFHKDVLPLPPSEMMEVLVKFAEKKFPRDRYTLQASAYAITLAADKEVIDWFSALVKKLSDK